jgi:hypothetical protein
MQKKYLSNIFFILLLAIIAVILVIFSYSGFTPVGNESTKGGVVIQETLFQEELKEKIKICMEDNPKATEEYCTDLARHDIAIINEDIALCERISNVGLREHCIRSLR